ncbi:MAG TPA: hypothetical protein VIE65_13875 [Methylobacter sp.]|jgi:hypothetical protein
MYVVQSDYLDLVNEIVYSKHYDSSTLSKDAFPPEFLSKHPMMIDSLIIAYNRCDIKVAALLWKIFLELEVNMYVDNSLELVNGKPSILKTYFPNEWEIRKEYNLHQKLQYVGEIMGS